jgi:SAM-dependent methyltransferase
MKGHWDKVYGRKSHTQLGWYEEIPEPTVDLFKACDLSPPDHILIVGAGATTLIDLLLKKDYANITANDISANAVNQLKERLGPGKSDRVNWVIDDLTAPEELASLPLVDLWQDRAVLHFFTEEAQRDSYFNLLRRLVKPGGFAMIATFSLSGAEKCSGLPVYRYNTEMLSENLGRGFDLIQSHAHMHTMPSGDTRDYIYTLFRRGD